LIVKTADELTSSSTNVLHFVVGYLMGIFPMSFVIYNNRLPRHNSVSTYRALNRDKISTTQTNIKFTSRPNLNQFELHFHLVLVHLSVCLCSIVHNFLYTVEQLQTWHLQVTKVRFCVGLVQNSTTNTL
jgi:hypothetical protein